MEVKGMEAGDICRTSVLVFFVPRPGDLHIEKLAAFILGPALSLPFVHIIYTSHSTKLEDSYRLETEGESCRKETLCF